MPLRTSNKTRFFVLRFDNGETSADMADHTHRIRFVYHLTNARLPDGVVALFFFTYPVGY